MNHLVQIGLLGSIGRFHAADRRPRRRGSQVVCRTSRGLEIGKVLRVIESDSSEADGELLRRVTPDDRLLLNRIERFRDKAFAACQTLISQRGVPAILVDVEHLFDGQSLYFYFLGPPTKDTEALNRELAEAYEAKVKFRQFSETLAKGCGPDCGTKDSGCGTGGCGTCKVRDACKG